MAQIVNCTYQWHGPVDDNSGDNSDDNSDDNNRMTGLRGPQGGDGHILLHEINNDNSNSGDDSGDNSGDNSSSVEILVQ